MEWCSPPYTHCTSTDPNNRPSADQLMRIFDIAFEKIYADNIKKLKLETQYCDPYEIDNMVEAKLTTDEYERMDRTMGVS
ncbi:hypothetical protein ACTXT7_003433 [Hymenolepis weldensis]